MTLETEMMEEKTAGGGDVSWTAQFLREVLPKMALLSAIFGALVLVGVVITAMLLSGSPTYGEAGGFAKAAVWVVWLAVLAVTAVFKWRVMKTASESKGYRLEEAFRIMLREYLPVISPAAVLGVAMTVALFRLDHSEYLLGLWLLAWGAAVVAMGWSWDLRALALMGVGMLALGFLQVVFWPSYVMATLALVGVFWLVMGAYLWFASPA